MSLFTGRPLHYATKSVCAVFSYLRLHYAEELWIFAAFTEYSSKKMVCQMA